MFRRGIVTGFPILMGYIPVGIAFGTTSVALGIDKIQTVLMSLLIFAGASQFALITLLGKSLLAGAFIPVLLNLRHVVYSSIISRKVSIKNPVVTAFGLTDEVFATSVNLECDEKFLWGLELVAYLAWVGGTTIGAFGGSYLLSNNVFTSPLVFSLTILFFILLIQNLEKYNLLSALIGGAIGLGFHLFGFSSIGLLIAGVLTPLVIMKIKNGRRC